MYSRPLGGRHRNAIQAVLAALIVSALLDLSATYSLRAGTPAGSQDLVVNLQTLNGTASLAGARLGNQLTPAAAFDALNMSAGGTLQVLWDNVTGIPRFLAGTGGGDRIPYVPTAAEIGNPLAIARGFLDENRALFRLDSVGNSLGPARIEPDAQLHFSNIRLPQLYKGIPVFGKQLIVHLDTQNQIVAVNGQFAPGLDIPAQPSVTRADAEQIALSDLRDNELDPADAATVKPSIVKDKTALAVYVDDKGKGTLAWSVKLMTEEPLGEWTIFVNARRPQVVHAIDAADTAKSRQTYTARNSTDIPGRLLVQEGERTSDPIGQAAQDAAGKVYDYYLNTFKRDGIDGRGSSLVSTVHYGSTAADAENAAWIGEAQQMVYGDGGRLFKPLAYGLDVVGHEFTHGVTESTAQLTYEGQSGALNESYSDIFGAMIDRANWTIGETVVKSPPYPVPYLRSLEDPELGGRYDPSNPLSGVGQPGTMSKFANLPLTRSSDNGGVHINSGIPSHAAFFVAQAIGKEKLEQIYYRTLTQYLTPDVNFVDAGLATVRAATDLYGPTEASAVRTAFGQVGINLGGSQGNPTPPPPSNQTPSATPNPVPPSTEPAGCRELIVNGSFEGPKGWKEVTSSHTSIIDPQLPHTGTQSAWLGGNDKESVQNISQNISVPGNVVSVKLSYYRLAHEEFSGLFGLIASDATFQTLLADSQGNQVANIESVSSAKADDTWRQVQFDLSRYAGQTISLVFSAQNPRGNVSSLFVDDVSMSACTTGSSAPAPPAPSDQVYVSGHIKSADTGRGISGAQIFILKPGISTASAAADGQITTDEVLTYATADNQGAYTTGDAVPRGHQYSVIIIASGYRPVLADNGIGVSASAPNPTVVDANMRAGQ